MKLFFYFSKTVLEDAREIISTANLMSLEFSHGWTSNGHIFRVEAVTSLASDPTYIFSIDGVRFQDFLFKSDVPKTVTSNENSKYVGRYENSEESSKPPASRRSSVQTISTNASKTNDPQRRSSVQPLPQSTSNRPDFQSPNSTSKNLADPFGEDPFAAKPKSMSNNNNNNNNNRNVGGFTSDPFATSSSDPFASTASSSSNFPPAKQVVSVSVSQAADPFSAPAQPFASFSNTVNPFESNTNGTSSMKPSHDLFSNPAVNNQAASINPFTNNNDNPFTTNTVVSDPFSSNTQRSSVSVSKANDNLFDPFGTSSISTQPAPAAPVSSSIQSLFDSVPNDPFNGSKGGFTADFTNQKSNDLFSLNLNLQNNPSPQQLLNSNSTAVDLLSKQQQDESEAVATEEKCKVTAGINNLVNLDLNDKKAEQNAQRRSSTQGPSLQSLMSTNPADQRRTSIGLTSSLPQNMPIPPNDPFRRPSIPLNGIPNILSNNVGASGFPNTANPSLAFGFGAPLPPPPQYGQIATQPNSGSLSGSFRAGSANISTMMAPGMQSYNSGYSGQTGIPTNTNKNAQKSSLDSLGGWK